MIIMANKNILELCFDGKLNCEAKIILPKVKIHRCQECHFIGVDKKTIKRTYRGWAE